MTPNSFDIETCKEVTGDDRCRVIEADARTAVDTGRCEPSEGILFPNATTYWGKVSSDMEYIVWCSAYRKRLERVERMKNADKSPGRSELSTYVSAKRGKMK